MASQRLQREWSHLMASNAEELGLWASPVKDNDLSVWEGQIRAPTESLYNGGVFILKIIFTGDCPFEAPKVTFITKIYHCNISFSGDICLNLLDKDWRASFRLKDLLLAVQTLLMEPNPEDPLIASIAIQYKNNRVRYSEIAQKWAKRYSEKWSPPRKNKDSN